MAKKKRTTIPGVSFSWKRALGIPTTKAGVERKLGSMILGMFLGGKKNSDNKDDNEKVY